MSKRILMFLTIIITVFILSACGKDTDSTDTGLTPENSDPNTWSGHKTEEQTDPDLSDAAVYPPGTTTAFQRPWSGQDIQSEQDLYWIITHQNGQYRFFGCDWMQQRYEEMYQSGTDDMYDGINCYTVFQSNLFLFKDDGVFRIPLYNDSKDRADYLYGGYSLPEEGVRIDEDYSSFLEMLNDINSYSRITSAAVEQVGSSSTCHMATLYVFTDRNDCFRYWYDGTCQKIRDTVYAIHDVDGYRTLLHADGTAEDSICFVGYTYFSELQSEISAWKDILYISAGQFSHTVFGVRKDGKVLIAGDYRHDRSIVESWTDVAYVITLEINYDPFPVALTYSGHVLVPDDCSWSRKDRIDGLTDVAEISDRGGCSVLIRKRSGEIEIIPEHGLPATFDCFADESDT